ncbi:MAG: carboxypeptidase M32 [Mycoplasmatales bacterium]
MQKILEIQAQIRKKQELCSLLYWEMQIEAASGSRAGLYDLYEMTEIEINNLLLGEELAKELANAQPTNEMEQAIVNELNKEIKKEQVVPIAEKLKLNKIANETQIAWGQARESDDYTNFSLNSVIEATRANLEYRKQEQPTKTSYEILLNDYEEDLTVNQVDEFFETLKTKLIPFIEKIPRREYAFISEKYPIEKQRQFCEWLANYLKFDFTRGMLKETEHPFMLEINRNDVRITTHYYEDNFLSAIFSTIHETGHALYEQNISEKYEQTILCKGTSTSVHESQSRLYENNIARNKAFWEPIYPILQAFFPKQLANVSLDEFYEAINVSYPSLIRIEADELTYPLHVAVRYEIEKEIFNEELDLTLLEDVWNQKMKAYLGVDVPSLGKGLYQDVHWPSGAFGYFATYALGSSFASQIAKVMEEELGKKMYTEMEEVKSWLGTQIHQYGKTKSFNELLKDVTNSQLSAEDYAEYLITKYAKLYNVQP